MGISFRGAHYLLLGFLLSWGQSGIGNLDLMIENQWFRSPVFWFKCPLFSKGLFIKPVMKFISFRNGLEITVTPSCLT
jgi:hypothetical protein